MIATAALWALHGPTDYIVVGTVGVWLIVAAVVSVRRRRVEKRPGYVGLYEKRERL